MAIADGINNLIKYNSLLHWFEIHSVLHDKPFVEIKTHKLLLKVII